MAGTIRSLTMAFRSDISGLDAGFKQGATRARQYSAEIKQINADMVRYNRALRQNAERMNPAARAALEARVVGLEERKATLQQQAEGRKALDQRLADYKAGKAAERAAQQKANAESLATDRAYQQQLSELSRRAMAQRVAMARGGVAPGMAAAGGGQGRFAVLGSEKGKMTAQFAMQSLAGRTGPEMGLVADAMFIGGAAGAVIGGVAAIGSMYQSSRRYAAELVVKQERHKEATRESVKWMRELAASYGATTRAGSATAGRAEAERDAARSIYTEAKRQRAEMGLLDAGSILVESLFKGGRENTSFVRGQMEDLAEYRERMERAKKLDEFASRERRIGRAQQVSRAAEAADMAGLAAMADGPRRQRRELEHKQRVELKRFEEERAEGLRVAALGGHDPTIFLRQKAREEAQIRRRHLGEQAALQKQFDRDIEQDRRAADLALIQLRTEGFARERALLAKQHEFERQSYQEAGKNVAELMRRQAAEQEELKRKQAQVNVDLLLQYQASEIQMLLMSRQITQGEATRRLHEMQMRERTGGPLDGGNMHAIRTATATAERLRIGGVLAAELEKRRGPMSRYSDFARDTDEAVRKQNEVLLAEAKRRGITAEEMATRFKIDKAKELLGDQGLGQQVDMAGRWAAIQSSIIRQGDIPRETLEEIKQLKAELKTLNKGVTVKKGP